MKPVVSIIILVSSIGVFGAGFTTDTLDLYSNVLNENRPIFIHRPADFDETDSVTFLFILDGELSADLYREVQRENSNSALIGIGIPNTDRNRDMLPGKKPEKFLEFIKNELIPVVSQAYVVKEKMLFGHSFAGGFVINAMLKEPGLFDTYIASSPTPIMDFVASGLYGELDVKLGQNIKFYFSCGSKDMRQVRKWNALLEENLRILTLNSIKWESDVFKGENHNTCNVVALISGVES